MSNEQRVSLGLDATDTTIDLNELVGAGHRSPPTPDQQKKILDAGIASGFVSRQPVRRRRRSPYTAQFGGKCRNGMKPLFQEVAERLDLQDTQALEEAILALIEKMEFNDLKEKYKELLL